MNKTARETALSCIGAFRKNGAWSDLWLKQAAAAAGLDRRDTALAYRMCYGVLQNLYLCDYYISHFSSVSLSRIEPMVLDILRLGVYQLAFMDRIPDMAAVDQSVRLAKKYANIRASGYVNALLRAVSAAKTMPEVPREDMAHYLSVSYSHPKWLVEYFIKRVGAQETQQLLNANNRIPPLTAQVNSLRCDIRTLEASLDRDGVQHAPHGFLPQCLELSHTGNVEELEAFKQGLMMVQDPSSQLAVMAAAPLPGQTVLDACSAPGGKAFASAMHMNNTGKILSFDIHAHKIELIDSGARRLGIEIIDARVCDASKDVPELHNLADLVIADVPCSGFGVIRKKPDLRYKEEAAVKRLPDIQYEILKNVSAYVKPGGKLLYSTCTLIEEENEAVIRRFLDAADGFSPEPFTLPGIGTASDGHCTLWPHKLDTDGFFIALMRKNNG